MALITCSECGQQVSDKASKCPYCGCPIKPSFVEKLNSSVSNSNFFSKYVKAVGLFFSNYFKFSGRSRRAEFWFPFPFTYLFLVGIIFFLISSGEESGLLLVLVGIQTTFLIPQLAVSIRRLHDGGHSGAWLWSFLLLYLGWFFVDFKRASLDHVLWYYPSDINKYRALEQEVSSKIDSLGTIELILLIATILLFILLIVFFCQDSERATNKYGTSTKYPNVDSEPVDFIDQSKGEENIIKNNNWQKPLIATLASGLVAVGLIIILGKSIPRYSDVIDPADEIEIMNERQNNSDGEVAETVRHDGYKIIIYNDNMGEFYHPDGRRICGIEIDGREEPMHLGLSQSLFILGKSSDRLALSAKRLFADYSDYLDNEYHPNKKLGVAVECVDIEDGLCYYTNLSDQDIEVHNLSTHKIEPSANVEYTMLVYNDEYGTLYDSEGKRVCGIKDSHDTFYLSKPVSIYGVTTDKIYINITKGFVYTSTHDWAHDEPETRKAVVSSREEGNATIYTFSKAALRNSSSNSQSYETRSSSTSTSHSSATSSSNSNSEWDISSVEQLQRKIPGTIWTCRPPGGTWHKLVFSSSSVDVYIASPSMGHWSERPFRTYNYSVKERFTSDTGEKCFCVDLLGDSSNNAMGSLYFLKGGEVRFVKPPKPSYKADYGDYHWE